jgi:hypothetical protein
MINLVGPVQFPTNLISLLKKQNRSKNKLARDVVPYSFSDFTGINMWTDFDTLEVCDIDIS